MIGRSKSDPGGKSLWVFLLFPRAEPIIQKFENVVDLRTPDDGALEFSISRWDGKDFSLHLTIFAPGSWRYASFDPSQSSLWNGFIEHVKKSRRVEPEYLNDWSGSE